MCVFIRTIICFNAAVLIDFRNRSERVLRMHRIQLHTMIMYNNNNVTEVRNVLYTYIYIGGYE